jgi:hypothetical protein
VTPDRPNDLRDVTKIHFMIGNAREQKEEGAHAQCNGTRLVHKVQIGNSDQNNLSSRFI